MQVGRELDALIAVRLFGWRWMRYPAPNNPSLLLTGLFPPEAPDRICTANGYDQVWEPSNEHAPRFSTWDTCAWWEDGEFQRGFPHYSTDIAAAWTVVERLTDPTRPDRCTFEMRRITDWEDPTWGYDVRFGRWGDPTRQPDRIAWARTAPLAICLASLKAVE